MGIFFALLTALGFAISNVCVRKGMDRSKSDNGVIMTLFINFIFLGFAALIYRFFIHSVPINLEGIMFYLVAGIFTTFIGRLTLFMSYREIGPTRGTAIKNSAPLFTVIFAVAFLHETIRLAPLVGILFVLLGLAIQGYFLFKHGDQLTAQERLQRKGYLLALTSAVVFGVGQGIRKPGMDVLPDPFLGAFISAVVALTMIFILEGKKGGLGKKIKTQVSQFNIFYFIAGIGTSIAMLSFFIAITYMQVSYVAVIAAMEPIITILLSKLFLKNQEVIQSYTIYSAIAIFGGVTMILIFA